MSDEADRVDAGHAREVQGYAGDARKAILEEIRAELKTQSGLKKEILTELKPTDWKTQVLELTKHPVLLLILGSIFGGWLSSCYQQREWDRQQNQLSNKQEIEKKITTRDEVTDSIIEAYSAAESAVRPFFYDNAKTFTAGEADRAKEWNEASKKWRNARLKLQQKLDLYFANPEIKNKFVEIVDLKGKSENSLFVDVNNVLGIMNNHPELLDESSKSDDKQSDEYKALKKQIRDNILSRTTLAMSKTRELRVLMQDEIENDTRKQQTNQQQTNQKQINQP
jgi:hypothetical protein